MDSNERIRELALQFERKRGITPKMISEKSGLCCKTIQNFIAGRRGISLQNADLLLDALGLEFGIRRKREGSDGNGN